jgi:phospholipid/cholesterol/gamma-HCH transport system substrate-binding protein
MENRSHALAAGLFTLLLVAAMIAVALWFRHDTTLRDPVVLVATTSVSGLNVQAAVRLRGVEVGRVENIRFDPSDPKAILITAMIDRDAPLTRGTRAQLRFQGVTGLAFVELSDDGSDPARLEGAPPRIAVDASLVEQIFAVGPTLFARVDEVLRRASLLMSDENVERVGQTLAGVQEASLRFAQLADRLGGLADQAGPVVARVGPVLKATEAMAVDTGGLVRRADRMVENIDALTLQLGQRLDSLDRITRSAERLGDVSQAFGESVVGVALPKLSDLLDDLSRNSRALDRAINQFHENPQSVVFGRSISLPGPGEPGFVAPAEAR